MSRACDEAVGDLIQVEYDFYEMFVGYPTLGVPLLSPY